MKIKRIEVIPGVGLNIMVTKTRTLYDENGNPVVIDERDEPMAMGILDLAVDPENPTPEEIEAGRSAISAKLRTVLTDADADLLAEAAMLSTQRDHLATELREERQARQAAIAERDAERQAKREAEQAIIAERAEKAELATKLEKANAEKNQLLLAAQRKNDRGNAGRGE